MGIKEKTLIKELNKYISKDLFNIILDKSTGKIICILRSNLDPSKLTKVEDDLNNINVLFKLISISYLKSKIKNSELVKYNDVKYVFVNIPQFQNSLRYNLIIKGNALVALNGVGYNVNSLNVEAKNIEVIDLSKYGNCSNLKVMPSRALNLMASDSITIDKSSVGIYEDRYLMQLAADNSINIARSSLFVGSGNILLFANNINLIQTSIGAGDLCQISESSIIENSDINLFKVADIKSKELSICSSIIQANSIMLRCNRINNKNNRIIGNESVEIYNKSCDSIDKVSSKRIVYNGETILTDDNMETKEQIVYSLKKFEDKKS